MSRAFGSDCSCSSLKFCCVRVVDVSMTGDSPVTVTVSCSDATASSTLSCAVNPRRMSMPSRFSVLKPGSSKVTVYVPGGTAGNRYIPSVLVTMDCTPIMLGLVALTVTPGRTAPLESDTLPVIVPVELAPPPCANAWVDASRQTASIATTKRNPRLMNASSFRLKTRPNQRVRTSKRPQRAQCANAVRFQTAVRLG